MQNLCYLDAKLQCMVNDPACIDVGITTSLNNGRVFVADRLWVDIITHWPGTRSPLFELISILLLATSIGTCFTYEIKEDEAQENFPGKLRLGLTTEPNHQR